MVGREKFKAKRSKNIFSSRELAKQIWFRFEAENIFANRRTLGREVNLPGRLKQKSSLKIHRNGTVPGAPEIPEVHIRLHMLFHRKLFVKFCGGSEPAYVVLCRCLNSISILKMVLEMMYIIATRT